MPVLEISEGKGEGVKIVVVRSPRMLRGLLRLFFGIKRQENPAT